MTRRIITALAALIKTLDLEQCIVTIDAAGCQKNIAEAIVAAGADYILCVKDNHKNLRAKILGLLSEEDRYYLSFKKHYFQDNTGHGRSEYRECVCDTAFMPEHYYKSWEGIKTQLLQRDVNIIKRTPWWYLDCALLTDSSFVRTYLNVKINQGISEANDNSIRLKENHNEESFILNKIFCRFASKVKF